MKAERVLLQGMKEAKHQPAPKLTIADMLEIAHKIGDETGHYPSYGEVSTGIYAGTINPDEYLEKRRKNGRNTSRHRAGNTEEKPEEAEG